MLISRTFIRRWLKPDVIESAKLDAAEEVVARGGSVSQCKMVGFITKPRKAGEDGWESP